MPFSRTPFTSLTSRRRAPQTEQDFAQIAGAGLNWIRLPVPYWAIETWPGEPFLAKTAWNYVLLALEWARKYGLRVYLELHTVPGSQNGYDNSGRRGAASWAGGNNVARTLDLVRFMADRVGGMIDVLELLNEPGGWQSDIAAVIGDFWKDGYSAVRDAAGSDLKVMIGDAFLGVAVGV